jgi:DNA polymerase-3 subunit delta
MANKADKARKFIRRLRREEPAPIYFFYGEETYLLDLAVEQALEVAAPEGVNDFNFDKFQGKEVTSDRIVAAASMLPMMSERRVVLVHNVQEMSLDELRGLEGYFDDPAPTTCLILHAMTAQKSIDGRKSIVKKLKRAATSFEFPALRSWEVEDFISKQARSHQMILDRAASAYLVEAVGTDLSALDGALERLDLYLGASEDEMRRVGEEDVREIIAHTRGVTVFELTDALGARRLQRALQILDRMLLGGEPPLRIMHMIGRHFRIVGRLQDASLRNASNKEMARAVGVSPYFVKDYARGARIFDPSEVRQILREMLATDVALKSSGLDDRAALERLLIDICRRSGERAS